MIDEVTIATAEIEEHMDTIAKIELEGSSRS